jgi:hypothetical protein
MARTKDELIPILFSRYYAAALFMRDIFRRCLDDPEEKRLLGDERLGPFIFPGTKTGLAMGLWFGALYIVVEGWQEARLSDPEIDTLLTSPNVPLLRRFRNAMFHFQGDEWLSTKLSDFAKSPDCVPWVDALMKEFGRYLVTEMERINA